MIIFNNKINMKGEYKSILFLIILFLSHCVLYCYAEKIHWNFDRGGADWKGDCKKGPQAPMDIAQPFTYKSKLEFNKYVHL